MIEVAGDHNNSCFFVTLPQVLVVPIGNNSLFDHQFQIVSKLRDLPFYELNRPVSKNNNPAFKFFNWNNGNLLFDYLRYDKVSRGPGEFDNFLVSCNVMCVCGIIEVELSLCSSAHRVPNEC